MYHPRLGNGGFLFALFQKSACDGWLDALLQEHLLTTTRSLTHTPLHVFLEVCLEGFRGRRKCLREHTHSQIKNNNHKRLIKAFKITAPCKKHREEISYFPKNLNTESNFFPSVKQII